MKVAIIGTNGLPAKYGGFETLTHHLVANFSESTDITVYCSKTAKCERLKYFGRAKLIYFPFKANGPQSLIYDFTSILHAFIKHDNLIILGFSGAFALPLNIFFRRNIIFNVGGIEWMKVRGARLTSKLERSLKRLMEWLCVSNSNFVVIDNKSFGKYIRSKYNIEPLLIEYGGDHVDDKHCEDDSSIEYGFLKNHYDLSVSRAQEDMNIHLLIEAYKKIPNRNLVIISNWSTSDYGKELYKKNFENYKNIHLVNAIYDKSKLDNIRRRARLYLHTHSLCGTAPSLVEAMHLSLPVAAFEVPANRATTEDKAFYFKSESELISILNNLSKDQLKANATSMKEIASRRYQWKRISFLYQSCLKGN